MIDLSTIITKTDYIINYSSLNDIIDQLSIILSKPTATFTYSSVSYYGIDLGSSCCLYIAGSTLFGSTFNSSNATQGGSNSTYISNNLATSGTLYLSHYKSSRFMAFTGNNDTCVFVNYHMNMWGSIQYVTNNPRLSTNGVLNIMANITIKDDIRNVYLVPYNLNGLMLDNLYVISQPVQISTTMPFWFELDGIGLGMKHNMVWCL